MVSSFISRLVILIFGTLYPAYASYKAVRTKNVREYVKWMMYWIVFAFFTCAETFTDLFLSFWFPFYYEIKIITVIYLLSPATKGSSILYRKFVHPVLTKREQEIDEYIAKAKEQGYHTMLNLGSKGVTYATSLIMQTAIKGGGGLVNQLRRSYSLSDLDEEHSIKRTNKASGDDLDSSYDEDTRLIRRHLAHSPRRTVSSAGQTGLYFPEVKTCPQPDEEDYFRQVPSFEEISSGYSSGDPLYYGSQRLKGEPLVRTASLGPSSRVRTRAATKNGLPKRGSLAEEGSSWAALGLHESQNETDIHFNFPFSNFPSLPYASFQHIVLPQYQQLLSNVTDNHMFSFIKHSDYTQSTCNPVDCENLPEKVLKSEVNEKSNNSVENKFSDSKSQTQEGNSFKNNVCITENVGSNGVMTLNKEITVLDKADENTIEENNDTEKADENAKEGNNDPKMADESTKEGNNDPEKTGGNTKEVNNDPEKADENENDRLDAKEKTSQERSGKYNKKPAPTPPTESVDFTITLGPSTEDEEAFFTPKSSPKLARKDDLSDVDMIAEKSNSDSDLKNKESLEGNSSVMAKKPKSKSKKRDFGIPKKLHMPKMMFSFWHQKGEKQASASESSSIASVEISADKTANKEDLEYFIPLKDNELMNISATSSENN